jgi:hypothetical protein
MQPAPTSMLRVRRDKIYLKNKSGILRYPNGICPRPQRRRNKGRQQPASVPGQDHNTATLHPPNLSQQAELPQTHHSATTVGFTQPHLGIRSNTGAHQHQMTACRCGCTDGPYTRWAQNGGSGCGKFCLISPQSPPQKRTCPNCSLYTKKGAGRKPRMNKYC